MSRLKPGPISGAKANTGILRCAQDDERLRFPHQRAVFGLDFGVFLGDDYGGYFVVGVE